MHEAAEPLRLCSFHHPRLAQRGRECLRCAELPTYLTVPVGGPLKVGGGSRIVVPGTVSGTLTDASVLLALDSSFNSSAAAEMDA